MEEIRVGSIEVLVVDVTDKLENLTTLPPTTRYDVFDKAGNGKMVDMIPVIAGMRAECIIDTSAGTWTPGYYFLYLRFSSNLEFPRLGPLEFKVNP
jgi:hypothetical protein